MNKLFRYKERGSSLLLEILGGIIVFLAMVYILPVNSITLSDGGGNYQAVFIATAICSGICCLIMGLFANYPVALSIHLKKHYY